MQALGRSVDNPDAQEPMTPADKKDATVTSTKFDQIHDRTVVSENVEDVAASTMTLDALEREGSRESIATVATDLAEARKHMCFNFSALNLERELSMESLASAAALSIGSLASAATDLAEAREHLLGGRKSCMPLIVDTDGALDDYAAIALLSSPSSGAEIILVTTARLGCNDSAFSAELMRRFLDASGLGHVPVVEGAASLTQGFEEPRWVSSHIRKLRVGAKMWGLYDEPIHTAPARPDMDCAAGTAIVEAAEKHFRESGTKVAILAIGPLTNIAYAVEHFEERMLKTVSHVLFAGDWIIKTTSEGKAAHPLNVRADEPSFWKVLKSKIPVFLCRPTNIEKDWTPVADDVYNGLPAHTARAKVMRFLACAEADKSELEEMHKVICEKESISTEPVPKFGTEKVHLKQDPVAAFFMVQPECFTSGDTSDLPLDVQPHVQRLVHVNYERYNAWFHRCMERDFSYQDFDEAATSAGTQDDDEEDEGTKNVAEEASLEEASLKSLEECLEIEKATKDAREAPEATADFSGVYLDSCWKIRILQQSGCTGVCDDGFYSYEVVGNTATIVAHGVTGMFRDPNVSRTIDWSNGVVYREAVVITFQPGPIGITEAGAVIVKVHEGGQAQRQGVKPGWIIAAVGKQPCKSFKDAVFQDACCGSTSYQVTLVQACKQEARTEYEEQKKAEAKTHPNNSSKTEK